ncbi:OPT/YSL family transporter, partial [Myxococcota bacterium]|nr:OPT/YSL family transporter [Myxococcota bacterium]
MKTTKNDDHPPSETPVPLESESTELRDNIPHGTEAFLVPLPQDLVSPQLTIRAIVTGMLMGSVLSLCNIYAGLKVGWSFNISIIAVLMSYGFWQLMSRHAGARTWTMLENNTSQTTASSAASISSAGLVTAIPALTILTGRALTWGQLAIWTLSVCLVGVFVGAAMRRQMILRDPL